MTQKTSKWTLVGGCDSNPGVWDDGNGSIITVAQHACGVVRRARSSYCGRGGDWVRYWPAGSSTGCWTQKADGPGYTTLAAARRAQRAEVRP